MGDDNLVPAWDAGSHVTDLDYALYTGSDYMPEVYYGRFSARDAAQLQAQIDKTLEYEQYLMPDPSYLANAVMIAGVDGTFAPTHGNGQINYGTNYYFNAAHGIASNTYLYPTSNESWVSDAVTQNVSDGAGYINYTAHGSQTSWAYSSFTISDINGLNNAHKYGTVVGNCCLTNSFQLETCFGEAWLRAANKGSIGYIGGSNNTYWDEDYWWGVGAGPVDGSGPTYEQTGLGVYDAAFHDHGEAFADWFTTQAGMVVRGNLAVVEGGSSRIQYYWQIYHLMGDPSLSTWLGVPGVNGATLPEVIFTGQNTLSITAEPYSYVGLSFNGELKASGLVDAMGLLTLEFAPFTLAGDIDLVITHHQKQPLMVAIPCVPNDGAYVTLNNHSPGSAEYDQAVSLDVTLQNIGTVDATGVSAVLAIDHPFVAITNGSQAFGTVNAGALATQSNAFAFDLLPGVEDQDLLRFDLTISGAGRDTWVATLDVMANAPVLAQGRVVIDDSDGGNDNGRMDPGETVLVVVPVLNSGHAATIPGNAYLESSSSCIDILTTSIATSPIAAGGTDLMTFEVNVDGGAPIGTPAAFDFVHDAGSYGLDESFTFPIGLVLEDWETGSFVNFPWEMGADAAWILDGDTYEGLWSARSGDIDNNEDSQLLLTVEIQSADELSFWYKVSSESNYDFLRFYIDGVEQGEWAGTIDWSLASFPVTVGEHTFIWAYEKDGSVSSGSDCAWIDSIIFPALGLPPAPVISIAPLAVETWVEPGLVGTEYLDLANLGEGELNWSCLVSTISTRTASIPLQKLGKDEADLRRGHVSRLAGGPDAFGYRWIDSNEPGGPGFDWVDISGIGTEGTYGDDSNSGPLALGFTMPFYGSLFDEVRICSNGWLSFTSTATSYSNQGIPTASDPNNLIAPFWEDLNPNSTGSIYHYSDVANGRFIAQWQGVPRYGNSSALETFQAILHADGRIVFQYLDVTDVTSVTVGIENADGSDGLEVVANAAYLENALAIELSFEEPWLVVSPIAGNLLPGGNQQLALEFNAMELAEGEYLAELGVASNDPESPFVTIPVTLHVGSQSIAAPVLSISSPTACATQITWDPVPGAVAYKIWSRTSMLEPWTLEMTVNYSFYDIDCIITGARRFYRVTAVTE